MIDFERVKRWVDIGGINILLFRLEDKIFKTDNAEKYRERVFRAADPSDYQRLLEDYVFLQSGLVMDLNNPRTLNEKIQWLKLHDTTEIKTRLSDKLLVRDYIKEKIGEEYLVPLLGVFDRFEDIDFAALPNRFALKCNHGSGWNIIVDDKNTLDIEKARESVEKWMHSNYAYKYGLELQYKNIVPKIIIEEYLDCADKLKDYKFYCFNGIPVQVWVDLYSGTPKHIRSIFDMNWNKISMRCRWPEGGEKLSEKPQNFELMKEFAAVLSSGFPLVRVGFFEVRNKLYMGEMTFTPMEGLGIFDPPEWDEKLGQLLPLALHGEVEAGNPPARLPAQRAAEDGR